MPLSSWWSSLPSWRQWRWITLATLSILFFGAQVPLPVWWGFGVLGALYIAYKNSWAGLLGVAIAVVGWYAHTHPERVAAQDELRPQVGTPVKIEGTIGSFPLFRRTSTRFVLDVDTQHNANGESSPLTARTLIVAPPGSDFHYGDRLRVHATPQVPQNFAGFDYRSYLQRDRVLTIIHSPTITRTGTQSSPNTLRQWAYHLRQALQARLSSLLPAPHSTLVEGMLLGVNTAFPQALDAHMRDSGLYHIVVVSGFNVTVVVVLITWLFGWAGRRVTFGVSLLAVLFYAMMAGGEAPVLRASLMGGIAGWGLAQGRLGDTANIILGSVLILALINPTMWQHDLGLHLSTIATLGLVLGTPVLERWFHIKNPGGLGSLIAASIAAQVAVTPLLITAFQQWSWIGLLSNVLTEPFVPLILAFGGLTLLGSLVSPFLGLWLGVALWSITQFLLWLITLLGQVPSLNVPAWVGHLGTALVLLSIINFLLFGHTEKKPLVHVVPETP